MRPRRTPLAVDVVLGLALAATTVLTLAADDTGVPAGLLAVLAVAPIAARQLAPLATAAVIAAALAAYSLLGYGDWPSAGLGMIVAVFTVATLRPRRPAAATLAVAIAVVLLSRATTDGVTWALAAQGALVFLCAWALGEATRRWARDAELAAADAERAVAEERTRVARELHDVVAHHMSVVALQAGLASYVIETDPAAAQRAIGHADDAGREALRDMRRMLDALRTDEDPAPRGPQPDLGRLGELVDRVRATGLDVELDEDPEALALPAGQQLCAYRVVQESLTNVLKHAGPGAVARVGIGLHAGVLSVEIADDGVGVRDHGRPGHGVRGMRERAELYGGVLEAGSADGGGFRVALRLPAGAPEPAAATA